MQTLKELKDGNGPSDISLELIAVSREIGIQAMDELCQRVLNGLRMPAKLALNIVVPIFKVKGDIRNCNCHIPIKLLHHGIKMVEMVL